MKNILIVGYPRSGNTYLGYLLSYHFNAPYYDMYDLSEVLAGRGDPGNLTLAPEAFSGTFSRGDQKKEVRAVLKSHELPSTLHPKHHALLDYVAYEKADPLILITREPKDVAVSFFYYRYFRQAFKRGGWSRRLPPPIYHWYHLLFHFKRLALRVAKEWKEMVSQWWELRPLVIRYEELLKQPEQEIRRVAAEFGFQFHAEYAREAIRFCELSHLIGLEKARNPGIRREERKYREGKTGSWEQIFSRRLQIQFDQLAREAAQLVGYQ
ncbi:MAG: sulfotransferase domain-containing protein [candidate division NC10 bacterium]|nr:sulfotransferase domain-containing protein [candidate division NC10 bacterium]